jgi:hypothetical protein
MCATANGAAYGEERHVVARLHCCLVARRLACRSVSLFNRCSLILKDMRWSCATVLCVACVATAGTDAVGRATTTTNRLDGSHGLLFLRTPQATRVLEAGYASSITF